MLETKELDINTPEGWKEAVRISHTNILIDRGIEPTEENLAKYQEEVNRKAKEFEAKYHHKPTPTYHCVGTHMFETEEEAKGYKEHMNYIDIDFNTVKGFNKLTPEQQELFIRIYKFHNSIQGHEYKEDYIPVSVKWIEQNPSRKSYLKVVFRNGIWLHYTQKGEWY